MRRAAAACAAAGVLLAAATAGNATAGNAAGAPTSGRQAEDVPAARLSLAAIPPWIETGSAVSIDLRVEPVTDDLEIVAAIHSRITSRTAFERTAAGGGLGNARGTVTVPLASLEPGPVGTHRLTIDLSSQGVDPDLPAIPVTEAGVYPLSVRLRAEGADAAADTLVTHLVVLDEDRPPQRLAVAWIWPIGAPRPFAPDGTHATALEDAVTPSGHFSQFVDALAAVPDIPVTLAPTPAVLDAWEQLAATRSEEPSETTDTGEDEPGAQAADRLDALRQAVALPSRQVLAGAYAPTDLTVLVAAGLEAEVGRQLARGVDVLRDGLGIRPDPRTFLASELNSDTLTALRDAGVDRLVVRPATLEPVFSNLTPARPFEIRSSGRTFDTVTVDESLSGLLVPPDLRSDPTVDQASEALVAQRLLAGLVTVALEAPGEERGVVLATPASWRPSTDLLVTVLEGLLDHPALRAVTVDAFFGRVGPAGGDTAARALVSSSPGRLRVAPDALRSARRRIGSLVSMLGPEPSEVAAADRLFLLATAAATRSGPSPRDFLAGLDGIVAGVTGKIRLPTEPSVTLTAQRGRIPMSFVNETGVPVQVEVRLSSDKLLFPEGEIHSVELPPRTSTVQLTVEARTTGSFPMTVEITSPDGRLAVGTVTMTVRSTAVSGVALAITVGAGMFLAGWWGNHVRKTRRARREVDGGPDEPGGSAP